MLCGLFWFYYLVVFLSSVSLVLVVVVLPKIRIAFWVEKAQISLKVCFIDFLTFFF